MKLKIDVPLNTPAKVRQYDRVLKEQKAAIEMRLKGHTYEYIGNKLDLNPKTVSKRIKDAFRAAAANAYFDLDELRAVEHQRLELCMNTAIDIMNDEEVAPTVRLKAIDRVEKLSGSIRKLFGADMPQKIEHTHRMSTEERVERVQNVLGIEQHPELPDEARKRLVDLCEHQGLSYDEAREYVDAEFEEIE